MSLIDHEKLRAAPVMVEPFQYLIAPGLVGGRELQSVMRDFPKMERPGSVPLAALEYGPAFNELVENLVVARLSMMNVKHRFLFG